MEISTFIQKMSDAIDIEQGDSLKPETRFKELEEWTSLEALSLIAMVHDEYGISITNQNIRELATIEDLFTFVSQQVEHA